MTTLRMPSAHPLHPFAARATSVLLASVALLSSGTAEARLEVGDTTPNVLLVEAGSGRGIELARSIEKNRFTVMAFVSTRCAASMALDASLAEAGARFRGAGVEILAVHASADDERAIAAHALQNSEGIRALRDRDAQLANILGAERMPEFFVVDADGQIVYRGMLSSDAPLAGLDTVIPALLRGEEPLSRALDGDTLACGIRSRQ